MGLPVITSHNRGCKEVVLNNVSGLLCHINDPFDLADKMEKIMMWPEHERQAMGIAGRAFMKERFSIENIYSEYSSTLQVLQPD